MKGAIPMQVTRAASTPRPLPTRPAAVSAPVAPVAAPVRQAAPAPVQTESFIGGLKQKGIDGFQGLLRRFPRFNAVMGNVTGPFIKQRFNKPADPNAPAAPPALQASTVEEARKLMAENFKPQEGKVLVAIAGGGNETVHCFVVSDVKPDGKVMITQAIAQYSDRPEQYKGIGGFIRKQLDKKLGNQPFEMKGVVTEEWTEYAQRSKRNSIVLMQLDADPAKAQAALADLKALVGKPYDQTMLAADPASKSTEAQMYCTEISSWFVNKLRPGTIKPSKAMGLDVFQVADHMKATDVNGGPLKVLYNGENRLDIKNADPFPKAS
jgi:hypothetical protein